MLTIRSLYIGAFDTYILAIFLIAAYPPRGDSLLSGLIDSRLSGSRPGKTGLSQWNEKRPSHSPNLLERAVQDLHLCCIHNYPVPERSLFFYGGV